MAVRTGLLLRQTGHRTCRNMLYRHQDHRPGRGSRCKRAESRCHALIGTLRGNKTGPLTADLDLPSPFRPSATTLAQPATRNVLGHPVTARGAWAREYE